jgi:hypothetical protein
MVTTLSMKNLDPAITTVITINLIATIYSVFSPVVLDKLNEVYLASIGGLWATYQLDTRQKNNRDKDDKNDGNF